MLIALLSLFTIVVLGKDISVGGLRDGDSAVHAMDGVLILDWIMAGPSAWVDPMGFAVEQYAHYPALAIGRHYPPGFAMVEAVFFAVFGVSAFSARACVVFFGCVATAGAYVFVRRHGGATAAGLAAVFLISMPAVVLWGRQEMLELPTLAVMIWAVVVFERYADGPRGSRLVALVGAMIVALLFRQHALCLVAATAGAMMIESLRGRIPRAHTAAFAGFALVVGIIVVASLDPHGRKLLRGDPTYAHLSTWALWTFYAVQIPSQVGVWLLPVCVIGFVVCQRRPGTTKWLMMFWLLMGYATLTVPDYRNPRFFFVLLFPFAVWAAMGVERVLQWVKFEKARMVVGVAIAGALSFHAMSTPVEHRPDYGAVVLAHREAIEGRAVLFGGLRDGDFVFAVRQHLPWRSATVVRTSKLLYTCNGRPDLEYESRTKGEDAVREMMNRFAFPLVFVERKNKVGVVEEDWLREYLAGDGAYRLRSSHRLDADPSPSFRDLVMDVYEAGTSLHRTVEFVDVPLPRAGRTVRVKLDGRS